MARREDEEGVMMTQMSNTWFNILQLDPFLHRSVGGIVVSIAAFQAVDPGSIPGRRSDPFFSFALVMKGSVSTVFYFTKNYQNKMKLSNCFLPFYSPAERSRRYKQFM